MSVKSPYNLRSLLQVCTPHEYENPPRSEDDKMPMGSEVLLTFINLHILSLISSLLFKNFRLTHFSSLFPLIKNLRNIRIALQKIEAIEKVKGMIFDLGSLR